MQTERARRTSLAADFCEKANAALAGKRDGGSSQEKVEQFRMLVTPSPSVDVGPAFLFSRAGNANYHVAGVFFGWFLDRLIKDGMWADFVVRGRSSHEEEVLDFIQRRGGGVLEKSEPEALSDRRIDTVEYSVRARAFDPFGSAIRKSRRCARAN